MAHMIASIIYSRNKGTISTLPQKLKQGFAVEASQAAWYTYSMISFMQKSFVQINNDVKSGGSIVVQASSDPHSAPPAPGRVDVVTTATCAQNMYLTPMPVAAPSQQKKD